MLKGRIPLNGINSSQLPSFLQSLPWLNRKDTTILSGLMISNLFFGTRSGTTSFLSIWWDHSCIHSLSKSIDLLVRKLISDFGALATAKAVISLLICKGTPLLLTLFPHLIGNKKEAYDLIYCLFIVKIKWDNVVCENAVHNLALANSSLHVGSTFLLWVKIPTLRKFLFPSEPSAHYSEPW